MSQDLVLMSGAGEMVSIQTRKSQYKLSRSQPAKKIKGKYIKYFEGFGIMHQKKQRFGYSIELLICFVFSSNSANIPSHSISSVTEGWPAAPLWQAYFASHCKLHLPASCLPKTLSIPCGRLCPQEPPWPPRPQTRPSAEPEALWSLVLEPEQPSLAAHVPQQGSRDTSKEKNTVKSQGQQPDWWEFFCFPRKALLLGTAWHLGGQLTTRCCATEASRFLGQELSHSSDGSCCTHTSVAVRNL